MVDGFPSPQIQYHLLNHNPKILMLNPEIAMSNPASAWMYLSIKSSFTLMIPKEVPITTPSIVRIVVTPNARDTSNTSIQFPCAAGYIKRGISGSHGPSTNIINKTHGVYDLASPCRWACLPR
jgi:hypothetical protein